MIVGTHAEDKRCTNEFIQDAFNQIHRKFARQFNLQRDRYFAVSNLLGSGVSKLKKKIIEISLAQHFMPDTVPLSFIEMEEKILAARQSLNPPLINILSFLSLLLSLILSFSFTILLTIEEICSGCNEMWDQCEECS